MRPDKVQVSRDSLTKEVVYKYFDTSRGMVTMPSYRVWHTVGLGYDGLIGYSPIRYAMQQVGLGLATERFGAKLFGNGTAFGGFLKHPAHLSKEAYDRLKKDIAEDHGGLDKALKLKILEEGMEYIKNTINPEEAQFLETRKFQKREMATFFLIQPHKIGDMEQATFGNIEEQNIEFVVDTMRYWLVKIEKSAKRKLFLPQEKSTYFSEFLMDALMRGDSVTRANFYRELYYLGALSPNDIREKENMNPITNPNGDEYFTQQNMIALSMIGKQVPGQVSASKPKQ
jgi:HK97 family phage portal protein